MWLSRLLLYTIVGLIASCTTLSSSTPTSIVPTATLDLSFPLELTLYGTGDNATPPFQAIEVTTADGQPITMDVTLLLYLSLELMDDVDFYQWDITIENKLLPIIRKTVATVVSQYQARDWISETRYSIEDHIKRVLNVALSDYALIVDDFLIRDIGFSAEFTEQVEQEVIATMTASAQLPTSTPQGHVDPDR